MLIYYCFEKWELNEFSMPLVQIFSTKVNFDYLAPIVTQKTLTAQFIFTLCVEVLYRSAK
jgi:hypothetical protein